ncbi:MAG TPA: GlxA family transcriptional regulator [Hyphomicrobium sp.]|nr:GlxA family transcriptional regulator [Hyphomicrobium sp.]
MQRVALLVHPGYSLMSFAAVPVFELANVLSGKDIYELSFLSEKGGPVPTSVGMSIETRQLDAKPIDTLIVGGGMVPAAVSPAALSFLKEASTRCRRIASICVGAFTLAEAGLLDGRRVTTHWRYARELRTGFPAVKVDDDRIFINDGPIWTSAGMTAGIDLALALVEADLGADVARDIAKKMVVYHRRAGGQSQFSALLELEPKSDRIQMALDFARQNLREPLSVEQLAEAARLSPRQFSRAFRAETGQSPAKAVEQLRLEVARLMMEKSGHPIEIVARESGFSDPDRMRRAFLRAFGQPPQAIRRHARTEAAP